LDVDSSAGELIIIKIKEEYKIDTQAGIELDKHIENIL